MLYKIIMVYVLQITHFETNILPDTMIQSTM